MIGNEGLGGPSQRDVQIGSIEARARDGWNNFMRSPGRESGSATSLGQYAHFLIGFQTADEFGQRVKDSLNDKDEKMVQFFQRLTIISPLVGMTAVLLYDKATKGELTAEHRVVSDAGEEEKVIRPASKWFKDAIEDTAETSHQIDQFFTGVKARVAGGLAETQGFLDAWNDDLQLNLAEVVNLGSCMAIHIQKEDCAVLTANSTIPIKNGAALELGRRVLELEGPEELPRGGKPIYRQYSSDLFRYVEDKIGSPQGDDGVMALPTYTSMVDVAAFAAGYKDFWERINKPKQPVDGSHPDKVKWGDTVTFLIRPEANSGAQARINILGEGDFLGLSVRVDKEEGDAPALALDIGGVKFAEAYKYAAELAKRDETQECVMNYTGVVDERCDPLDTAEMFYPSIMKSPKTILSNYGDKMALFIAAAMAQGEEVGLRQHDHWLNHAREGINKQQYYDNFFQIATEIKDALVARP